MPFPAGGRARIERDWRPDARAPPGNTSCAVRCWTGIDRKFATGRCCRAAQCCAARPMVSWTAALRRAGRVSITMTLPSVSVGTRSTFIRNRLPGQEPANSRQSAKSSRSQAEIKSSRSARTGLSEINDRSFPKRAALVVLRLRPRQRAGGRNVRPHRHRQAQRHRSAGLGSPMSSAGSWEPCRSGSTNSFRGTGKKTGDAIRLHSPGFSPGVSSPPFLRRHTPHEIPLRSFAHACRPRASRASSSTTSARRSGLPLAFAGNGALRRAGQDVLIRRIARRENHGSDRVCCRTYGQPRELSSLEGFCRHDVLAVGASDARTRVRSRRTNLL